MGSIRLYRKKDGALTYHAEVRLAGHPPRRGSFACREEAERWIAALEDSMRSGHSSTVSSETASLRYDWSLDELRALYALPFPELLYAAQIAHRQYHDPTELQLCQLISIKTGGCSENCRYCAQSAEYQTTVKATPLMEVSEVVEIADRAGSEGVTRLCMGAAWRQVRNSGQFERVLEMVREVSSRGLEVCCTLGMLDEEQIERLKEAGLYAYNHNLDTSKQYYPNVITSHTYEDRIQTLGRVARSGVSVCSGGIVGLGETIDDRLELIRAFASQRPHPESVPINRLEPIPGTPFGELKQAPVIDYVRLIAVARIVLRGSMVRLSGGRLAMTEAEQALCLLAGANSIFVGDRLLTVANPTLEADRDLVRSLGMRVRPAYKEPRKRVKCEPSFLAERVAKSRERGDERTLSFKDPELIDLASNDYLGLAASVDLVNAVDQEYHRLISEGGIRPAVGATGSRLLTGNQPYVEALEVKIAKYHLAQSALLFNSGYSANTGLLSCLPGEEDAVLLDAQVHASTWDGARLSRAKSYLFRHNDMESLEKQLKRARESHQELFVCVESLYSMSGDLAPLIQILRLCERYEAWLVVDEAHATGVIGADGRGAVADLEDSSRVIARIHTFGKALGAHGAAIVGSEVLRDYLINRCRTFIYTTAFPLHALVSISTVYDRLPHLESDRQRLQEIIRYFALQIDCSPLPLRTTPTVVQSIPVSGSREVVQMSQHLKEAGLDVRAIRPPTVRQGSECLRVCLHAFNTTSDIDRLIEALSKERQLLMTA
jgi:biotin synthase